MPVHFLLTNLGRQPVQMPIILQLQIRHGATAAATEVGMLLGTGVVTLHRKVHTQQQSILWPGASGCDTQYPCSDSDYLAAAIDTPSPQWGAPSFPTGNYKSALADVSNGAESCFTSKQ